MKPMHAATARERDDLGSVPPSGSDDVFVDERHEDTRGVLIPRAEVHLVVRFGPVAAGGLDAHAAGLRAHVYRKLLRRGQRTVSVRLPLGTSEHTLGVPARELVGRNVDLRDLWSDAATRRLKDRLAATRSTAEAADLLRGAVANRGDVGLAERRREALVRAAADKLAASSVCAVADELGVSERNLRRIFFDVTGLLPKNFAKLARFRRALRTARTARVVNWAAIAVQAGYYDQAHLISEFRAISGVTPTALLLELRSAIAVG